jgi:phage anti-repressor protein
MKELIKIKKQNFDEGSIQTANARKLHAFLGIGRDFPTWIRDRIEQFGFVELQDYVILLCHITQLPAGHRLSQWMPAFACAGPPSV